MLGLSVGQPLGVVSSEAAAIQAESGGDQHLKSRSPRERVEQGRSHYQSGQFVEALEQFRQAAQTYADLDAPLNQALALSYLARTYQELDEYDEAQAAIDNSLALLPLAPQQESHNRVEAQVLSTQGELQLIWGQPEAAIASWDRAATLYEQLDDSIGLIGIRVNQVQALRSLGLYYQAERQVQALRAQLVDLPASQLSLTAWRSLGNTQYALGNHDDARQSFERSLEIAEALNASDEIAATRLSLGNLERALGDRQLNRQLLAARQSLVRQSYCPDWDSEKLSSATRDRYQQAYAYYQQMLDQNVPVPLRVRSQLNQLSLDLTLNQAPPASALAALSTNLSELPPSRFAVYARVRFAQELSCLPQASRAGDESRQSLQMLAIALDTARELGDKRAESYALGRLGRLYELQQPQTPDTLAQAKAVTDQAMQLAQQIQATDIAYLWQWQMGRLLNAEGRRQEAIQYYAIAFDNLRNLRSDLVVLDTDIQFSFREKIEPIYRQYADLLLQQAAAYRHAISELRHSEIKSFDPAASDQIALVQSFQDSLQRARAVIEALQLAELDNFFRDACATIQPESIDALVDQQSQQSDLTSAVLYTIILPERLDIVLKVPNKNRADAGSPDLLYYSSPVAADEVRRTVLELRRRLVRPDTLRTVNQPAQDLYDWLIRPALADLQADNVNHVVFVLDGVLRNIPMAALHDGDRYLLDEFTVSLSPGLQVLESASSDPQSVNVIAAGISDFSERLTQFPPLPYVENELEAIAATFPQVTRLLNRDFTRSKLMAALNREPISVLHLASHGQFSSLIEETFILASRETDSSRANDVYATDSLTSPVSFRSAPGGFSDTDSARDIISSSDRQANAADVDAVDAIGINELAGLLEGDRIDPSERKIDLLVLSACQTASGDERATLGLAGVAVRAGARSTLASLWSVDDQATAQFISEFYRQFYNAGEGMSKVDALRQAQQHIRDFEDEWGDRPYEHPRYWSAFVLLGNWL